MDHLEQHIHYTDRWLMKNQKRRKNFKSRMHQFLKAAQKRVATKI